MDERKERLNEWKRREEGSLSIMKKESECGGRGRVVHIWREAVWLARELCPSISTV